MKHLKIAWMMFFVLFCQSAWCDTYYRAANPSLDPNAPSDATLTTNVQKAMNKQKLPGNIHVLVQGSIVYLSGKIDTVDQAKQAVSAAGLVEGVKDVFTDNLFVKEPTPTLVDEVIAENVKAALVREKIFPDIKNVSELPITVQVTSRTVYLRGTVDTSAQLAKIIQLVKSMRSVPRVIPVLQLRMGPANL